MNIKTPKFNETLKKIFDDLVPHSRACKQCGKDFDVVAEDIEFYHKLQVPPPTLCPACRLQRRLGYRISFFPIFYKKSCSAPDHDEKVVTYYSEKNPVKVYDDKYYLSDAWDGLEFGMDVEADESFFQKFHNLAIAAPRQTLSKDPKSVDCEYVVSGVSSKDCYFVAIPYSSERVYYAYLPSFTKDCIDVSGTINCEQSYECIDAENCYNCKFVYESSDCMDSAFLYDCRNCSNCFGCTNLRNKKYCFFNEQLTREQYEEKMKEINLGSRSTLSKYKGKFQELLQNAIRKHVSNVQTENCVGDNIHKSKNCYSVFLVVEEAENLRYVSSVGNMTETMDVFGGTNASLGYECSGIVGTNDVRFSTMLRTALDIEYSAECTNCEHCFGCFGLKDKKFCIFNKQYTEEEYWEKIDELKTAMLERGEYGEFFPLKDSWYPYKDSNAQVEFPLTKEEIVANRWHWEDEQDSDLDLSKISVLQASEVPDDIADVSDDILKTPIVCERTGKPFKIMPFELDFYRKSNIPIPTVHPLQRIKDRFEYRKPFRLWKDNCRKCGVGVDTVFDPAKKLRIYCEACYNAELH